MLSQTACEDASSVTDADGSMGMDTRAAATYAAWGDPLSSMPVGPEQTAAVCAREGDNMVRDLFCGDAPPRLESLADLEDALTLGPAGPPGFSGVALAGHSTALSARSVSAINPRVILYRLDVSAAREHGGIPDLIALGFTRGEQFAELVTLDRVHNDFEFYVIRYEQACNDAPDGCLPGDLLTAATENDWRNITLYDETSLSNTTLDCAPCHQPDGPGTSKMLRMQEFDSPWTHWFVNTTEGGKALLEDYVAAKGEENIANLSRAQIETSSPGGLSMFVGARNHDQPNVFDSLAIENEVRASAAAKGGSQPFDNRVPGESATWRSAYERSQRGEHIPVPYHDVKVTDPDKLARVTEAYQAYQAGSLAADDLPDLRDVFPDDPARLAAMGMATEPGLSGEDVLVEACSMCHNERLDQSLSRARFTPDLSKLSRAEKDVAIARLRLPPDHAAAMPPARLRVLTQEARTRAIEALQR